MTPAAVVGPGRAGTLLAVALARTGHRVVAVAGGNADARRRLAALVAGARPVADPREAAERARLLVLAVPDAAIEQVVTGLAAADAIGEAHRLVHLAGALGLAPLRRAALAGAGVAACHPAMTIPSGSHDPAALVGAAWAVTAPPADREWAHELVRDLGGDPYDLADDRRTLYHAGLALGSNAAAAAVAAARQLLLAAGVDNPRAFLDPLVSASVGNVAEHGAVALTGPIVRGDVGTVAAHLAALRADLPALLEPYRHLARAVLAVAAPGLDAPVAASLRDLLDEEADA